MATAGHDSSGWESALLRKMGCKHTGTKVEALQLWAQSEGMPADAYNWLATEKGGYGGSQYNSAGVFAYPSFAVGIAATAATIEQSNMSTILKAFKHDSSLLQLYRGINASPWCTEKAPGGGIQACQGGRYPVALADQLGAGAHGPGGRRQQAGVPPGTHYGGAGQPPPWDWSAIVTDAGQKLSTGRRRRAGYIAAIHVIR